MLAVLYYFLWCGLSPGMAFSSFSSQCSPQARFVLPFYFSNARQSGTFTNYGIKQVIAPFLITLQVANRGALTSENVAINSSGSTRLRSQESILAVGSGSIPEEYPMSLMGRNKEVPGAEAEEIFDHKPLHGGVPNALTS